VITLLDRTAHRPSGDQSQALKLSDTGNDVYLRVNCEYPTLSHELNLAINLSAWLCGDLEHVWPHQNGATPTRKSSDNSQALAALIARKTEIDTILARLTGLSDEHFSRTPEDVTWADVGTLGSYLEQLRRVSDAAFQEGEHGA
jgi:hypothetical protein